MVPTLEIGQRVLVNRIGDRFGDPVVGDVVVFHPPAGAEQTTPAAAPRRRRARRATAPTAESADVNFIKRVVAGPGDQLDPRRPRDPQRQARSRSPSPSLRGGEECDFPTEITIPADHYFMMGDNRGSSDDSRFWGPVPRDWIIGGAFATYWPPKRIGLL